MKVIIEVDNKNKLTIELYPQEAPNTVLNFITLVKKGYYNGLKFHRVIPGFVSQGGCPYGDGTGGPGYTIACETNNNKLKHELGSLSMAHRGKDTGGSQFFICHAAFPHLDGVHTVFGKVIDGIEYACSMRQNAVMTKVELQD